MKIFISFILFEKNGIAFWVIIMGVISISKSGKGKIRKLNELVVALCQSIWQRRRRSGGCWGRGQEKEEKKKRKKRKKEKKTE